MGAKSGWRRAAWMWWVLAAICAALRLTLAWAGPATTPQARVDAAYAAMGADRLKTLHVKARLEQFDPGESYALAEPDKPGLGTSELTQTRDLTRGLIRNEWVRPKADDGGTRTFTEIITPTAGLVIGNDAVTGRLPRRATRDNPPQHTMSGRRMTATLREWERPMLVLEMKRHPAAVAAIADQTVQGKRYPALQYRNAQGTFVILFNPATNLPARVRSLDWDALEGDSVFEAAYSDWRDCGGAKIAFDTLYMLNGMKVAELKILEVQANAAVAPETFDFPPALLARAAKPAPPGITPFQWIIRRQYTGFYFDSDAMYMDDGGKLTLVDVAPGVSQTQGGTHNTLFIATKSYLVAVEAPNDDGQAIPSIALAKRRYPGKPIRYLILTHHHVDHVGGMRSYAAEGATIVVGRGDGEYFRRALARPEKLNWNAPKRAFTAKVIEVDGKWSVSDGGREVDAYEIENPHAGDYLMPYVPDAKLGIVTDLYTPGTPVPSSAAVVALVRGVDRWGLKPERFAGGHGSVNAYSEVVQAAQKAPAAAR